MIKHSKYRCQININPPRTKRIEQVEPSIRPVQEQYLKQKTNSFIKELTSLNCEPLNNQCGSTYSKTYSPRFLNSKVQLKDISTDNRTSIEYSNQFLPSRRNTFESPPQSLLGQNQLSFTSIRQNCLIGRNRQYSKSIYINECVSEFNFDQNQTKNRRGSSQELNRLRKQNEQLLKLLGQDDEFQCICSCGNPYVQEQTQYLRRHIYVHYDNQYSHLKKIVHSKVKSGEQLI